MSSEADACRQEMIICAKQGDFCAKEMLVQMHHPLIRHLARRLHCGWMSDEDLVQAGIFGFLRAIERYDTAQPVKLITYAVPWILGEMRKCMKSAAVCSLSLDEPIGDGEQTLHDALTGSPDLDFGRIDLKLALERLKREQQLLICLRYFRDMTQKETAVLMGISQTQVSRIERSTLDELLGMLTEA